LNAARKTVFGSIPWQRCQFHLQQNASQYVPRQAMKKEVAADIRAIFNAPDREQAQMLLDRTVKKYGQSAPRLASWMEVNLPEGLTVFSFPVSHWRFIRTTNILERVSQEIKRRTKVVRIFPNEVSCLRLVSAILMECDEAWQTGRRYLTFEEKSPLLP
jgi:transposase-like protein